MIVDFAHRATMITSDSPGMRRGRLSEDEEGDYLLCNGGSTVGCGGSRREYGDRA
jgi:hypothetical protein